jgi:hypothetical protein
MNLPELSSVAWGAIVAATASGILGMASAIWTAIKGSQVNKALEHQRLEGTRQLEAQRHQFAQELARQKSELDRAVILASLKSNELFRVLPEVWRRLNVAQLAVRSVAQDTSGPTNFDQPLD